jgi:hypothetical protein
MPFPDPPSNREILSFRNRHDGFESFFEDEAIRHYARSPEGSYCYYRHLRDGRWVKDKSVGDPRPATRNEVGEHELPEKLRDLYKPPRPKPEDAGADAGPPEADPLTQTLGMLPRSSLAPNLVKFLAGKPGRTATLKEVCKHIYKTANKGTLAKTRLLVDRNSETLEKRGAPLRLTRDPETNIVSLIEC